MSPAPGTSVPQVHLHTALDNLYDRSKLVEGRLFDTLQEMRGSQPAQVTELPPSPSSITGKLAGLYLLLDRMEDHAAEIQRLVGQHGASEGVASAEPMQARR